MCSNLKSAAEIGGFSRSQSPAGPVPPGGRAAGGAARMSRNPAIPGRTRMNDSDNSRCGAASPWHCSWPCQVKLATGPCRARAQAGAAVTNSQTRILGKLGAGVPSLRTLRNKNLVHTNIKLKLKTIHQRSMCIMDVSSSPNICMLLIKVDIPHMPSPLCIQHLKIGYFNSEC